MLEPLPYHRAVAEILEREQPKAFASLRPSPAPADGSDELDQALLRSTYRLDATAHPGPHAALARATSSLDLSVPAELYVDDDPRGHNAELVHVPGRAVVIVSGPLLDLLTDDELCAVLGHELAHHVLWTADGGRYLAATRLLEAAEHDARTPSEYLETARRLRLATELYADRGALVATGRLEHAVAGLLKASTGMRQVDPASYLRQAAEVDVTTSSAGSSHPETVLRAWALERWHVTDGNADDDVERIVSGDLDLATLDLPGQDRLRSLTADLVRQATFLEALRRPETLELAERYGAVVAPAPTPLSEIASADWSSYPLETRRYLAAVLADLATAPDEDRGPSIEAALQVAGVLGLAGDVRRLLEADLGPVTGAVR